MNEFVRGNEDEIRRPDAWSWRECCQRPHKVQLAAAAVSRYAGEDASDMRRMMCFICQNSGILECACGMKGESRTRREKANPRNASDATRS